MVRKILSLCVGFLVLLSISGIAAEYTVYVVVHGGIGDPYWKKIERGITDAAKLYPELDVHYMGPEVYNFERFMAYLTAAIAAKPDYLICTITNYEAQDEILRDAMKSGITVAAIDTPDPRPVGERIPYLTYVGEIPYLGGRIAMTTALKFFTPHRVVFANHHPGAINIQDRGRGVGDVCKEVGIPFEAIDITTDPVKGAEMILDYIKAHPDVDLVVTANMLRANALVERLIDAGINPGEKVKIITYGADNATMNYIEQGEILFTLDEQPYYQGYLSIVYAALYLKYGFTPPPEVAFEGVWTQDMVAKLRELVAEGIR